MAQGPLPVGGGTPIPTAEIERAAQHGCAFGRLGDLGDSIEIEGVLIRHLGSGSRRVAIGDNEIGEMELRRLAAFIDGLADSVAQADSDDHDAKAVARAKEAYL